MFSSGSDNPVPGLQDPRRLRRPSLFFRTRSSAALLGFFFAAIPALSAQAISATQDASTTPATDTTAGVAGIVPYIKGYNLSIGTTSQHDSSNGWSSFLTPDAAYRFNRHFSVDASAPLYAYIDVVVTRGTMAKPVYTGATEHFVAGDTSLNGHYQAHPAFLDYDLTATMGLPTGSTVDGLGAGKVTYFFNNHVEKSLGIFTPDIELGIGDSSDLIGERIRKSYTTVGSLVHFQAGTGVELPRHLNFEADAYENLPLTSEILYSTTGKGRKKVTTATNDGVAEDNGFETSLDIPLSGHITLAGFYNRSLRNHIDTAGFSFTFLLKAPPRDAPR